MNNILSINIDLPEVDILADILSNCVWYGRILELMKIVSLNVDGGRILDSLLNFLRAHRDRVDIFCFQEVFDNDSEIAEVFGFQANLLEVLKILFPNLNASFARTSKPLRMGLL